MMQFRKTKKNLMTILNQAAKGRFRVVGHQVQVVDSTEILGKKRRVQVFFAEADYPKGESGQASTVQEDAVYRIELAVSAATKVNLAVLNDPTALDAQREAALDAFKSSSELADDSMDEFYDLVWNILMDGRNADLCEEAPFKAKNRWIESFRKENPVPQGEYVELTASIQFSCKLVEQPDGDIGVKVSQPAFDITDDVNENNSNNTGSLTGQDPE